MIRRRNRKRNVYTLPEDKMKAGERVLLDQIPTRRVAEEINVSQTSIQQWVKQYKDFRPQSFLKKNPMTMIGEAEFKRLKEIEAAYKEQ